MPTFLDAVRDAQRSGRVILMDGAMGAELQKAGLGKEECGESWNLTQPEKVRAVHRAYADAGAQCLLTNTFQANPKALSRHRLGEQAEAINRAGVELAGSCRSEEHFVLGDIGPIEYWWDNRDREKQALRAMVPALWGVNALLFETCSLPDELWVGQFAQVCAAEHDETPLLMSFAFRRKQKAPSAEWFAEQAPKYGAAVLGVNCGRDIGMDEIIEIVQHYRKVTDLPILARPNAGTPKRVGDQWVYPETPAKMAARLPELIDAGATLIGGCCGTTPAHIAAFREVIDRLGVAWRP